LLSAAPAAAQPALTGLTPPRLFLVQPGGAKAGSTVELTLSGQDLDEPQGLLFSRAEIKSELVSVSQAPRQPAPRRQRGRRPVRLTATSKFKVTIPSGTPPGIHDVRIVTKGGVSNPRAFVVGDLEEVLEKEPNNDVAQAQRVELNTTISGIISAPTDVDYFVFAGKKGQRVVVSCLTTSIDSRLQAAVELYGPGDRRLAFNRNYRDNDALLDCTLPEDGDFHVRLYDFTYTQGGPAFFYRLTISTAPWIDAVYPPVVEPGKRAKLTVYGRNLPGGKLDPSAVSGGRVLEKITVTVDAPREAVARQRLAYGGYLPPKASALDGFEYRLRNASGTSNPFLLTYARAPVVLDNEANDTPETAQEITLPCEIAGRFEKKRDRDWYTFSARRGEVWSIEAFADRLGSPLDLYLVLRDARTGRVLVELDDDQDVLHRIQFFTRSDDPPRYRFVVPADGSYQLLAASREVDVQAGPRHLYRVRITPEQPDFRLVVMPAALSSPDAGVVRQGGRQDYTVFVWRLDGWNGPIDLAVEGLPSGVTCRPQVVGGGAREASLVLQANMEAPSWTGTIRVKGTAVIDGRTVVREARPATITWPVPPQQNVATVSRLDRSLVLAVRDKAPFSLDVGIEQVVAVHNTRITVPLKLTRHWPDFKTPVRVLPLNLPGRLQFQPVTLTPGKDEAKLNIDIRANVPPGVYSLVLRGLAQAQPIRRGQFPGNLSGAVVQPAAPIKLIVLPRQFVNFRLAPNNLRVKAGDRAEVVVQVARRFDFFTGAIKVQLLSKVKGIRASEVTLPAGKDRVTLTVDTEGAEPGTRAEVVVRVSAEVGGKVPVTQEARLGVSVVK
jgi:hypothetical protein